MATARTDQSQPSRVRARLLGSGIALAGLIAAFGAPAGAAGFGAALPDAASAAATGLQAKTPPAPTGAAPSATTPRAPGQHVVSPAQIGDTGAPLPTTPPRLPMRTGQAPTGERILGEHRIYVLPVYWSGNAPAGLDREEVTDDVTAAGEYLKAATGNEVSAGFGWVAGWQRIALSSREAADCDLDAIHREVRKIIGGGGPREHMVVYLDNNPDCDFSHLETLGLSSHGDGYNITNGVLDRDLYLKAILHNNSVSPSGSLDCVDGSTPVPLSGDCDLRIDTDPWDPTSNRPYGQFGSPMGDSLWWLGVLDAAEYTEVTPGSLQRLDLQPLTATSGRRGVWFDRDGYRYHIDYRVPAGLDDWIDDEQWDGPTGRVSDPGGGVVVHRQSLTEWPFTRELVDFAPDADHADIERHPGLGAGQSYTSPDRRFSLQVTGLAATAKVTLRFPTLEKVDRLSGPDRYTTSARISQATYSPNVPVAYIASGLVYTDALSGASVAGKDGGPILLVDNDEIPQAIKDELTRLKPGRIVVLGGPITITPSVERDLGAYTAGNVVRLSGADRYDTSAAISAASYQPEVSTAFVASGLVFTDALSGAPVAGRDDGPVLLVHTERIPGSISQELIRLKPDRIVVLGGPNTISDGVLATLAAYAPSIERWSGPDRFSTSTAITTEAYDPPVATVFIASGRVYTDALSGAPVAGTRRSPVLLVDTDALPSTTATEIRRLQPTKIVILGGPATVSLDVQEELATLLP